MEFKSLTPNVMVKNVQETVSFYENVLGFKMVNSVVEDNGVMVWAMVSLGGVSFMFQEEASLKADLPVFKDVKTGASLTFYIDVVGVKALYKNLRDKVDFLTDLSDTFYGSVEFSIRDVNGYVLTFAERAE